jgi:predicted TIM-barrel fold metal-dependent hydrolase
MLTDEQIADLLPAAAEEAPTPIPVRLVSSDEFAPAPQTEPQRAVQARLAAMADEIGGRQGLSRRRFFQTAAGMAAGFLAMNDVYGPMFEVSAAEAAEPGAAEARAASLRGQFIVDVHTHFLRDDSRLNQMAGLRTMPGQSDPALAGKPQTIEDLKYSSWFKEVFLDSDTKVALLSSAPADDPADWFLTNEMMANARAKVNERAGSRRALSHAVFTPGQPGWMDQVERAIALKPDSWKGYTIGDVVNMQGAKWPWRMDDEKVVYPFYERIQKAGITTVCVHKGLMPPGFDQRFPHLLQYFKVDDVGKAAQDFPGLDFVIYHSGYRAFGGKPGAADMWSTFERTGRLEWVSDLADIPAKYCVKNVYGDLGQVFAQTVVIDPRVAAALMGILIKGLGPDKVVWGTDAIWSGSPQWQIEGLRRLEIPEDLRRRYGWAPLGPADGPVKSAIFGLNSARTYRLDPRARAYRSDRLARMRAAYLEAGPEPSNRRYGYVARG